MKSFVTKGRLVVRMQAAQAHGMQRWLDWLAVLALETGSRDAKSVAQPGSLGTRFVYVCHQPSSLHALARVAEPPNLMPSQEYFSFIRH